MQCVPLAGGSFRAFPPEVIGAHFDDYVELGSEDKQPIDTCPQWVATFNACTLRGPAKRHSFERQWHDLRYFAIGFQEARPKKTRVYESEYYWARLQPMAKAASALSYGCIGQDPLDGNMAARSLYPGPDNCCSCG